MRKELPPGPRAPAALQTIGFWTRPVAGLERLRGRFGQRFTTRLLGQPPFVILADPEDAKAVLTAPPDVLHPGEGARLLEPIVGRNSVILLDEAPHLEQRKLLLPAFHGDRIQRLTGLIDELTERELDSWPIGAPVELHEPLQALTLEIILRAVFGLDEGPRLDAPARAAAGVDVVRRQPGVDAARSSRTSACRASGRFAAIRDEVDEELYALIEERRAERATSARTSSPRCSPRRTPTARR